MLFFSSTVTIKSYEIKRWKLYLFEEKLTVADDNQSNHAQHPRAVCDDAHLQYVCLLPLSHIIQSSWWNQTAKKKKKMGRAKNNLFIEIKVKENILKKIFFHVNE